MNRQLLICLIALLCPWTFLTAQDNEYIVVQLQITQEDGTVLKTQPLQGRMMLKAGGTYVLEAESRDSGIWHMEPGVNGSQPRILFDSESGQDYFAYIDGNVILIWLARNDEGHHIWAKAELKQSGQQASGDLSISAQGHFTRGLMYGGTNALAYQYVDPSTGQQVGSDSVGFAFSPDGSFIMRNQSGQNVTSASGRYTVSNGQILCKFDAGGDDILFVINNGGQSIIWVSNGETVAEYQFLGFMQ